MLEVRSDFLDSRRFSKKIEKVQTIQKVFALKIYEFTIRARCGKTHMTRIIQMFIRKCGREKYGEKNINDAVALEICEILSDDIRTAVLWMKFKFDSSRARLF